MLRAVDGALSHYPGEFSGVCQHGTSAIHPRSLEPVRFLSRPSFDAEVAGADIIITHAGVGSVHSATSHGRRAIVFARRSAFGEIVDDHQLQLVAEFDRAQKVFVAHDEESLAVWLGKLLRGEVQPTLGPSRDRAEAISLVASAMAQGRRQSGPAMIRKAILAVMSAAGQLVRAPSINTGARPSEK
jgi:UDP-N-acetylglucosamine transferase subunit ALG13